MKVVRVCIGRLHHFDLAAIFGKVWGLNGVDISLLTFN